MSETREEEAKRKALEKLIHDKRWERDGYGQLKCASLGTLGFSNKVRKP
jgi:hypothetical protein